MRTSCGLELTSQVTWDSLLTIQGFISLEQENQKFPKTFLP